MVKIKEVIQALIVSIIFVVFVLFVMMILNCEKIVNKYKISSSPSATIENSCEIRYNKCKYFCGGKK